MISPTDLSASEPDFAALAKAIMEAGIDGGCGPGTAQALRAIWKVYPNAEAAINAAWSKEYELENSWREI